jgi:hypothetical protein
VVDGGQQVEARRLAFAPLDDRADHLGDHVAGPAHHHPVADAHVLAVDLALVVQRGVGDRHAADEHRLEARHRRDRPGAADLHVDAEQAGRHLLGRVLVGHRPARLAGDKAELLLAGQGIHLVNHAVDVEGQARPQRRHVGMEARQALGPRVQRCSHTGRPKAASASRMPLWVSGIAQPCTSPRP